MSTQNDDLLLQRLEVVVSAAVDLIEEQAPDETSHRVTGLRQFNLVEAHLPALDLYSLLRDAEHAFRNDNPIVADGLARLRCLVDDLARG